MSVMFILKDRVESLSINPIEVFIHQTDLGVKPMGSVSTLTYAAESGLKLL
jgi:hypothetical protein